MSVKKNTVIECYENYREEDRLTTNQARQIEFITTARVLQDIMPSSGKVLDCAAGTGIYAFHLADKGYEVTATDITPRHVDIMNELCFWTDTYYSTAEEMEHIYESNGLSVIEHFAQDGMTPMFADKVDKWPKEKFDLWCEHHYKTCREKSLLGMSNHVIIAGRKDGDGVGGSFLPDNKMTL